MAIFLQFVDAFKDSWNKNIDTWDKNEGELFQIPESDHTLRIIHCDEEYHRTIEKLYPIPEYSTYCFYAAFNGPVCDEAHWEFFKECGRYVYQKIGFSDDFELNVRTFMEYWNTHIKEFNKSVFDKNNRCVVVVANDEMLLYRLAPTALKCFIKAFNGLVCDSEHFDYFVDCIRDAQRTTGIYVGPLFTFQEFL